MANICSMKLPSDSIEYGLIFPRHLPATAWVAASRVLSGGQRDEAGKGGSESCVVVDCHLPGVQGGRGSALAGTAAAFPASQVWTATSAMALWVPSPF